MEIIHQSYPQSESWKNCKIRVIHRVMNIIHIILTKNSGLHSKKTEYVFCIEIIKLLISRKSEKNILTFQLFKNIVKL